MVILFELMFATMGGDQGRLAGPPYEIIVLFHNLCGLSALSPLVLRTGVCGIITSVLPLHLVCALARVGATLLFLLIAGTIISGQCDAT